MLLALLTGFGGFLVLFFAPQTVHGSFEPTLFGLSRTVLISCLLFAVAGSAGLSALTLYFWRQRSLKSAIVCALGSSLSLLLILLAMIWGLSPA
jgi:hypothetical protein